MPLGRGWAGSGMLVVIALLVVLRPDLGSLLGLENAEGGGRATAYVARVVDGDTIEASIGGRTEDVRLIGIDTPETVKPGAPVECFGPQASRFTHRLLEKRGSASSSESSGATPTDGCSPTSTWAGASSTRCWSSEGWPAR